MCLSQCVKAEDEMALHASGRARVHVGQGEVRLAVSAIWSDLGGCAGAIGSDEVVRQLPDSAGQWVWLPGRVLRAPVGARSALLSFEVSSPSGSPFTVHLDELSCLANVLFADGFEGGSASAWSAAVP